MKKIITLSLVFVLFLSSCSIDWNGEKDDKIVELEKNILLLKKEKDNDLFKNNNDCISLGNNIKNSLESGHELLQVFYSPIKHKCLYVDSYNVKKDRGYDLSYVHLYEYGIYDSLDFCQISHYEQDGKSFDQNCDIFDSKIKKLKGE